MRYLFEQNRYIERDGGNLADYNGLADGFNFEGKQAALLFRTDYYVLFYNKDIFNAASVDYPTNDMTWAQFDELARKVTSGEGTEKKYGAHFHTWQALIGMSFIAPNFIGFLILTLIPVLFTFVLSVCKWNGFNPIEFVGLKNF